MTHIACYSFGCRVNQHDTETIRTLLAREHGGTVVDQYELADIYLVNTCTVTARADANARKIIRKLHSEHPEARIVVTGCYAQRAPQEVAALPGVCLVVGTAERAQIGAALRDVVAGEKRICVSPIAEARVFLDLPIDQMRRRSRAVVKIQEGCNQKCTFCIVPKTRGCSRSRRPERVLDEVRKLVAQGYQEIVLTGVHLGDYGLEDDPHGAPLMGLLRSVSDIPGAFRVRLSSIEPTSVSEELIELVASEQRFARHFHVPLQSAADTVLQRMNRGYTADDFAQVINRISRRIPRCGIGTDVICGFPGETEADFQQTYQRLYALPITYIHPFPYSLRPGSEAASYGDDVTPAEKKRRVRALKRLSRSKGRAFREGQLGTVMEVLLESSRGRTGEALVGWSDNYLRVRLSGDPAPPGGLTQVRVQATTDEALIGELATSAPASHRGFV